jgi:hypothetical protein
VTGRLQVGGMNEEESANQAARRGHRAAGVARAESTHP